MFINPAGKIKQPNGEYKSKFDLHKEKEFDNVKKLQDRKTDQIKEFRNETDFNIKIGQALNLAVQENNYENDKELKQRAKQFYKLIEELRKEL